MASIGGAGGSAAAAAAGGGDLSSMMLEYDDVTWERTRRGDPMVIGRGPSGAVFAGTFRGLPVAIKAETLDSHDVEPWLRSAEFLFKATSLHIVAVQGILVNHEDGTVTHYIVMERMAGAMSSLLLTPGGAHYGADMALRLQLLADVADGLAYLHANSVIHADVKPDNVLLSASSPPVAKLSDFGSSVRRRAGTMTHTTFRGERGTLVYMDPTLLDYSASITAASDVYSFGVMAWQVLTGRVPYEADIAAMAPANVMEAANMLAAHVCGPRGKRPPVTALVERGVPPAVVALVEACWAPAQRDRPAMKDVNRILGGIMAAGATAGGGGSVVARIVSSAPVQPASRPSVHWAGTGSSDGGAGGGDAPRRESNRKLLEMSLESEGWAWDHGKCGTPVILGNGATGVVFAGHVNGRPVAIKQEAVAAKDVDAWVAAVWVHFKAKCPYIVEMLGALVLTEDGDVARHYIVMERLPGTLSTLVRRLEPDGKLVRADLFLCLQLLADVAAGLQYLHARSIIHADVKPDNVLLAALRAKLGDFGSCVLRHAASKTRGTFAGVRGTYVYMDPCLLDSSASIKPASDVYSFGMLMWQVGRGSCQCQGSRS